MACPKSPALREGTARQPRVSVRPVGRTEIGTCRPVRGQASGLLSLGGAGPFTGRSLVNLGQAVDRTRTRRECHAVRIRAMRVDRRDGRGRGLKERTRMHALRDQSRARSARSARSKPGQPACSGRTTERRNGLSKAASGRLTRLACPGPWGPRLRLGSRTEEHSAKATSGHCLKRSSGETGTQDADTVARPAASGLAFDGERRAAICTTTQTNTPARTVRLVPVLRPARALGGALLGEGLACPTCAESS